MQDAARRAVGRRSGPAVLRWVIHIVRGFCIGTADLVPGVSGSTVAVLFGVYERLLRSVRSVAGAASCIPRGDRRGAATHIRRIDWTLVVPVAAGALVALGTLARAVDWLLEHRAEPTAGAFAGLVLAAVVVAARQVSPWRISRVMLCAGTAGLSGWIFGLSATPVAQPAPWVWFAAGVLGICAMILPGVSGAFALLIIGLYAPAINAVSDRDWSPLGLFAGGAVVGALAFSSLLIRLLDRRHDTVMTVMVGLMLGSLRVLWPWPNGVGLLEDSGEVISGTGLAWPEASEALWPAVCAVIALALALAASRTAPDPAVGSGAKPGLLEAP